MSSRWVKAGRIAFAIATGGMGELRPHQEQPLSRGELAQLERVLDPIIADLRRDPRAFGFDLVQPRARPRNVADEVAAASPVDRVRTELFLREEQRLLALVPRVVTLPDGRPLDAVAIDELGLDAELAQELSRLVRATIQARLGAPLTEADVQHVTREAAWELDRDPDDRSIRAWGELLTRALR